MQGVTKGRKQRPPAVVIYGPDGTGKTAFAAYAPDPIFIEAERGSDAYDVARFDSPKSYDDVIALTERLINEPHDFKTVVYDSLDWIERLLHQKIRQQYNAKSIASAAGGYGKGFIEAAEQFDGLIKLVDKLRDTKKMNVIFICHAQSKTFNDPENQAAYDKFGLKLDDRANAVFREYADAVLFTNFEVFVKTEGDNVKGQAYGTGKRVIHVERKAGFDAKNRFGLSEPIEHQKEKGWTTFFNQIKSVDTEAPEVILKRIESMMPDVPDDLKEKVVKSIEQAGTDSKKLTVIENRLKEIGKIKHEQKS